MLSRINITTCFMFIEFLAMYAVSTMSSMSLYRISMDLLLILTIYVYKKNKKFCFLEKSFYMPYISFFVLIIIASLLTGYWDSVKYAFEFTKWSIVTFFLCYSIFQKQYHSHVIVLGIAVALMTICYSSLAQFLASPLGTRINGYFDGPNELSTILVLSLPFLILYVVRKNKEYAFRSVIAVIALITCCIVGLTGSRGGMMGLCFGGLIFLLVHILYIRKLSIKKLLINAISVAVISLTVVGTYYLDFYHPLAINAQEKNTTNKNLGFNRSYDNERILMWKSSYEMWKDHKLYGVGLYHWNQEYITHYISQQAKETTPTHPHNAFMFFLSMTGLLGGIGFCVFVMGIFFYLCRKIKKNGDNIFLNALLWAFLAIMVSSLVDRGIIMRDNMILFNAYLGISLASVVYQERINKQQLQ